MIWSAIFNHTILFVELHRPLVTPKLHTLELFGLPLVHLERPMEVNRVKLSLT